MSFIQSSWCCTIFTQNVTKNCKNRSDFDFRYWNKIIRAFRHSSIVYCVDKKNLIDSWLSWLFMHKEKGERTFSFFFFYHSIVRQPILITRVEKKMNAQRLMYEILGYLCLKFRCRVLISDLLIQRLRLRPSYTSLQPRKVRRLSIEWSKSVSDNRNNYPYLILQSR